MYCPFRRLLACFVAAAMLAGCASAAPTPTPTAPAPAPLPAPVSAGLLAVDSAGRWVAAANPDSGSVTLVDAQALAVLAEWPAGPDPRTVAFAPDGAWLLAANYGGSTLTRFSVPEGEAVTIEAGPQPYGVVTDGRRAFVSLAGPAQVAVVDVAAGTVIARVPVEAFPAGLALSADAARLYVTHLYTGRVSVLDTEQLVVETVWAAEAEANLAQFVALSPDGARAYLPHTHSLASNPNLAYNTTVLPVVAVLDLAAEPPAARTLLRLDEVSRPASLPFAAAVDADGQRLYVANAGTNDVAVLDLDAGRAVAQLEVGSHPRGLALAPNGKRLFVANSLDGTLDVFDTASLAREATLALTQLPLAPEVLEGKRLFNTALPPMSREGWIACAACHFDGGADGRTWVGFADGPRDTPALYTAASTLPLHWNGDLDELQDVEHTVRGVQFGQGLVAGSPHPTLGAPNAGRSAALDALAAYLASLRVPASPYAPTTSEAAESVARGERAFRRWGCAVCHPGPLFTDQATHASGIGDPAQERNLRGPLPVFDTPSLLGVWATAPYFHDGSAPTLRDTLFSRGFHNMGPAMGAQEIEDLLAYMRALPYAPAE